MKSRQLSNRLLVSMVLVCCCQQIWAGLVVKGAKAKNSTVTTKATTQTTKLPKVSHKAKTTETITTLPEFETTTLPAGLDLDGRSAFINNQYVAEPIPDTSPPLYEILQQQMETVLSNTGGNIQVYANDSPQIKEALDNEGSEKHKLPEKPIFGYDMGHFGDYDEEETSEYEGEYTPDNCEDTEESLGDNEGGNSYAGAEQLINYEQANQDNLFEHNTQNKPYDSSSYGPQGNANQGAAYGNNNENKPKESNNYAKQQTNTYQGQFYVNNTPQNDYASTKPMPQANHSNNKAVNKTVTKPKTVGQSSSPSNYGQTKPNDHHQQPQQVPANHYVQSEPIEHYGHANQKPLTNQIFYGKPQQQQKPNHNQKPFRNNKPLAYTATQQTNPGYGKTNPSLNINPSYNRNYSSTIFKSYNNTENLNSPYNSFNPLTTSSNTLNPSLAPNFSYDNTNAVTSTPFSGNNQLPHNDQKRHLSFSTVSSSTQYISTPLADLMFKISISMAKSSNSKLCNNSVNNQEQVSNVLNGIDAKTA